MEPTDGQQYNLKWTNHTNNILEMFSQQLLNGMLVDVTLFCEGQYIRAHKMVLSACSPYFQDLFRFHTVDHPVIIMNGARFIAVKQMVDFMYQGEIKVSDADLDHLLTIAENLQIKGLCKIRREGGEGEAEALKPEETPKKRKRRKLSQSPGSAIDDLQTNGDYSSNQSLESPTDDGPEYKNYAVTSAMKITRPKNAFMIFSGEWRRKLQLQHQDESNREITVRLGNMWKNFSTEQKDEYFKLARQLKDDHRLKYPEYHLARDALKGKRKANRKLKRRKGLPTTDTEDNDEANDIPDVQPEPIEPKKERPSVDEKEEEPDENNLVMADTHSNDSTAENNEHPQT
ncbi:protein jim lovell-like [Photinus pyralis]|uniref:HMG box domain-containing protein n=1 Tax=Photinus pyralis TaxID=7054 RepID=A0A1Y1KAT3_PHOPY|nr:protein jim lovell-like [Photinus pyralis]